MRVDHKRGPANERLRQHHALELSSIQLVGISQKIRSVGVSFKRASIACASARHFFQFHC